MPAADTALARVEEMTARFLPDRTAKRRMLVIVNPYATTVSNRLRNLVVYALAARYEVEAVDTEKRDHATQICREAAQEGFDCVVAFGGDGTVNEAANGLAGTDTPLAILPGGATNVLCRILGVPTDVVDATEHLLDLADGFHPRRMDLGMVDDRYFTFASGVGLDASVVERVDRHPRLKARLRQWYYTYAAVSTYNRRYLVNPPHVNVRVGGRDLEGVTVIVQNCDPYTYFASRPIRVNEGVELDDGAIGVSVLRRATIRELPTVTARAFSGRARVMQRHRQVEGFPGTREAVVEAADGRMFPVQVDGDYIGEFARVEYGVAPGALRVVA